MILKEGIKELGLSLDDGQIDQFKLYYALLTEWNSFMNLTGEIFGGGHTAVRFKRHSSNTRQGRGLCKTGFAAGTV